MASRNPVSLWLIGLLLLSSNVLWAADAPTKVGDAVVTTNPITVLLGLLLIVVIIVGLGWLLKKMGAVPMSGNHDMRIVSAMSVGTRERIVMVQIADQQFLLGVSPGQVSLLQSFEQPIIKQQALQNVSFSKHLQQMMQRKAVHTQKADPP